MSYNLFLDDIRQPAVVGNYFSPADKRVLFRTLDWVIVRNYEEFVDYIEKNGLPKLVSFDHDLADAHYDPATWTESFQYHEKTGYECAKWLIEYIHDLKLELPEFLCHSANPVGKERILHALNRYKRDKC